MISSCSTYTFWRVLLKREGLSRHGNRDARVCDREHLCHKLVELTCIYKSTTRRVYCNEDQRLLVRKDRLKTYQDRIVKCSKQPLKAGRWAPKAERRARKIIVPRRGMRLMRATIFLLYRLSAKLFGRHLLLHAKYFTGIAQRYFLKLEATISYKKLQE